MGAPGFIIVLALFASPPLVIAPLGLARIAHATGRLFKTLSPFRKVAAISSFCCLLLLMTGWLWFLLVFWAELTIQLSCDGAACAQGGVGVVMATAAAWLSLLGV